MIGAVAEVILGRTSSAPAQSTSVSMLRRDLDITLKRAEVHRRVFFVTHERSD